jgi:hypothetical protein
MNSIGVVSALVGMVKFVLLDVAIRLLSIRGVVGDVFAQSPPDGFFFFVAQMLSNDWNSLVAQLHEGQWICLQVVGPGGMTFP